MTDLEQELTAAFREYADSYQPSAPPIYTTTASAPVASLRRGGRLLATAAAVVALVGGGLVWRSSTSHGPSVAPTTDSPAGRWTDLGSMPLSSREYPSVLWTGTEFIVWGGQHQPNKGLADGARFDPLSSTWRPMATDSRVRPGGLAVWAGDRMVVLSGTGGEAYDPSTDRWSTLPTLQGVDPKNGFTDAVWADGTLLGIAIHSDDTFSRYTMSVWKLVDGSSWLAVGTTTVPFDVQSRLVSVPDQFEVHDPVATDDGFVMWDGSLTGWRFTLGKGWASLPALARYDQNVLIVNSEAVWADGQLRVVGFGATAEHDDTRIATLTGNGWSAWTITNESRDPLPRPGVAAGGRIVVLGPLSTRKGLLPLAIDIAQGIGVPMIGSPLQAMITQGAGWSGTELLVCGGQRPTGDEQHTTSDPSPVTNQCALWTP